MYADCRLVPLESSPAAQAVYVLAFADADLGMPSLGFWHRGPRRLACLAFRTKVIQTS